MQRFSWAYWMAKVSMFAAFKSCQLFNPYSRLRKYDLL
jgi:hypothetical protein